MSINNSIHFTSSYHSKCPRKHAKTRHLMDWLNNLLYIDIFVNYVKCEKITFMHIAHRYLFYIILEDWKKFLGKKKQNEKCYNGEGQ